VNILLPSIWKAIRPLIKVILLGLGLLFSLMLLLSFTSLPFWADYYLGSAGDKLQNPPEVIVVMGGSGMPSPNGLIRCWYAAKLAHEFPEARIIVALPGDTLEPNSSIMQMGKELVLRGVDSTRIVYENEGTNTRWEALNIKNRFYPNASASLMIVSSPTHIYRAVRSFKKVGFEQVGGMASFSRANEESLDFDTKKLGGSSKMPEIGDQLSLRYKIWTRLHIQISLLREYTAIAYYWLMGWI